MPNDLYESMQTAQIPTPQMQQNPREVAMSMLKQHGIDIPASEMNNPQAIIQRVLQSGKVSQDRLSMIQQMMQARGRR